MELIQRPLLPCICLGFLVGVVAEVMKISSVNEAVDTALLRGLFTVFLAFFRATLIRSTLGFANGRLDDSERC
jgi:hypothetical protein